MPSPTVSTPPAAAEPSVGYVGYFSGHVASHYAEALVTEDKQVRIWISSAPQCASRPDATTNPVQFVGTLDVYFNGAAAIGNLVDEGDGSIWDGADICASGVPAELILEKIGNKSIEGLLRIPSIAGSLDFALGMSWPTDTYVTQPGSIANASGFYVEALATFAASDDTVVIVDDDGRIFFQSAGSGCVGNGELIAHGDGSYSVYDVELRISDCGGNFAHLNRSFAGLGTRTVGIWDWGDWLVLMLDAQEPGLPRVALTMWGSRL